MNIIITGPQGSGKGTQAELLAKKKGLLHLETGELFRKMAEKNTPLGRKIAHWVNKGALIPDDLVFELLRRYLTKKAISKGFILDGSPRGLNQIKWLEKHLVQNGSQIDKLVLLEISEKVAVKRLSGRRACPKCGRNYNLVTLPPQKDELCDDCQVKLSRRQDDTPKAIAKRLFLYQKRTTPMVKYYEKLGKVIRIDGEKSVEEVFTDILRALK